MPLGPVIGPLVLCGVCFRKSTLSYLTEIGVKDSKKLSPTKRSRLSDLISNNCHSFKIILVFPKEIDQRVETKTTMNKLEEIKMAEIINNLKPQIVFIDAVDVDEERFSKSISHLLNYQPKKIISKHRADDLYPIVSAASILAKNKRDLIIEELKDKYGDFGSGYTSDKKTTKFLRKWIREHKSAPTIARKSWETTKKIINEEVTNKKISDYF
jgi:ribonuclease HII